MISFFIQHKIFSSTIVILILLLAIYNYIFITIPPPTIVFHDENYFVADIFQPPMCGHVYLWKNNGLHLRTNTIAQFYICEDGVKSVIEKDGILRFVTNQGRYWQKNMRTGEEYLSASSTHGFGGGFSRI